MNTPIDINDPRLIDFVLGELEPEEARKLGEALQLPENRAALQEAEALRAAMHISESALKEDPVPEIQGLNDTRRQVVLDKARSMERPRKTRSTGWGTRLLAAAAMLVLCVGIASYYVFELRPRVNEMIAMNAPPAGVASTESALNDAQSVRETPQAVPRDAALVVSESIAEVTPEAAVTGQEAAASTVGTEQSVVAPEPAEAADGFVPSPVPETVIPDAAVATSEPESEPMPEPAPEPAIVETPSAQPEPAKETDIAESPAPVPEPVEEPVVAEAPAPVPEPAPEPVIEEKAVSVPEPTRDSVVAEAPAPVPEPAQEAVAAEAPLPAPEPEPEPVVAEMPAPAPEPAPEQIVLQAAPMSDEEGTKDSDANELVPIQTELPEPFFGGTPIDYWGPNLEPEDYADPPYARPKNQGTSTPQTREDRSVSRRDRRKMVTAPGGSLPKNTVLGEMSRGIRGINRTEGHADINGRPEEVAGARLNAEMRPPRKGKDERVEAYIVPRPPLRYPGGETYSEIKEQAFWRTDEEPLSTFSLHPDTAAYTNIKRFLEQGQLPPANAVRIEEMINYFSYNYPRPEGKHPFSVNIEVGPCPWASGHLLAKIGLQGRELPREERPAANLVFLVDTSGSMEGPNRLPLVKESLKALVEMLKPEDRVGIVTYAGESKTALKSTPVSKRDHVLSAIEELSAGGSTHGSAGIQDAYKMAEKNMIDGGINRVILATDGDFNVGVTSRDGLLSLIEKKRRGGVFLTVLGYGMGNLKDANLETLATKGNGNYAYIDSYSEARRVLVEQLTGTLMTIAKDAKIQVEFNPARVRSYRLIGFENRQLAHRDFNDDTKDAGEIGAGHSVTALYQIVPVGASAEPGVDDLRYGDRESKPAPEPGDDGELMFVKLRYKQPDSDTSNLIEVPVAAGSAALEESTDDFRFAAAVAAFGLVLRDSEHKGAATCEMARELARAALAGDHNREEFLDLVVTAKTVQSS